MASLVSQPNGRRCIQLSPGENRKRPKIHLGKVTKREAESVRCHIETLIRSRATGTPAPMATADWLVNAPDALRARLVELGLVDAAETAETPALGAFLDEYIESRSDVTESTRINYEQVRRNLLGHFGPDRTIDTITPGDADGFRVWMLTERQLAQATVNRHVKRARQFFKWAVRKRILSANPFAEVKAGASTNKARHEFIHAETVAKVLDACPTTRWRLLFVLGRYGGLRIPSECVPLRWSDVLWDVKRIKITSPKTAHQGKPERIIPMFPELEPVLLDAYHEADPGEDLIFPELTKGTNLRSQAIRIINRAGVTPWRRLFQNLRSSRATELLATTPAHVVNAWLGHTEAIADAHYRQVTDEDYEKAVQKAVHDPVQTAHEPARNALQAVPGDPANRTQNKDLRDASKSRKSLLYKHLTPRRLELRLPG